MEEEGFILHEGKKYARVSKIIQHLSDFSRIDPEVLKRKQEIGTELHDGVFDFLNDEMPIMAERALKYFESFTKWFKAINPKVLETEKRYFNQEKMITCRMDGIFLIPFENLPVIVDYKTALMESPTWIYQAHLYHYIITSQGVQLGDRVLYLKLDSKGGIPKTITYQIEKPFLSHCISLVDQFWTNKKLD